LQVKQVSFLVFILFIYQLFHRPGWSCKGCWQAKWKCADTEEASKKGKRWADDEEKETEEGMDWEEFMVNRVIRVDSRMKVAKQDLVGRVAGGNKQGVLRDYGKS
jgi:hypothetical protein